MLLRPFLYDPTACASYLFGCGTHSKNADECDSFREQLDELGS